MNTFSTTQELPLTAAAPRHWRDRTLSALLWLLIAALWACARPYRGIRHDAILYSAQAARKLTHAFDKDLFFQYGSQDNYSVFSWVYGRLYGAFGFTPVALVTLLVAQVALCFGLGRLLRNIGMARWQWPALLMLASFPHIYGGLGVLAFAEPFVTARTICEPIVVWALVALVERRWILAVLGGVVALAWHPIIALPVLVVGWIYLIIGDRRWAWLALALPVGVALGFAGVGPFVRLVQRYDPEWWAVVKAYNGLTMVTTWGVGDLQSMAFDFLLLYLATLVVDAQDCRRLVVASLIAGGSLIAITIVGGDLLHISLILQAQQWRVMWWMHLWTLLMFPVVLTALWRRGGMWRVSGLLSLVALVAISSNWTAGWAFVGLIPLALLIAKRKVAISAFLLNVLAGVLIFAAAAITLVQFQIDVTAISVSRINMAEIGWYRVMFAVPMVPLGIGLLLLTAYKRGAVLLLASAVALLFVNAGIGYDQSSAWVKFLDAPIDKPPAIPFTAFIPEGESVYWDEDIKPTWFGLRRPSYYSAYQAGGLLFNRETALEYRRRAQSLSPMMVQREICKLMSSIEGEAAGVDDCAPTLEILHDVCKGAMPLGLHFMVARWHAPQGLVSTWHFAPADPAEDQNFYLYDCRKIMATAS